MINVIIMNTSAVWYNAQNDFPGNAQMERLSFIFIGIE